MRAHERNRSCFSMYNTRDFLCQYRPMKNCYVWSSCGASLSLYGGDNDVALRYYHFLCSLDFLVNF